LIDARLIPFGRGLGCARDVKIFLFKFFIVGNELLFSDRGGGLECTGRLPCWWQLGILARLN